MTTPQQSCEVSGIQNTVVRSQNFFKDILIPLLDSYPEAELREILLIKSEALDWTG
jgi:hypothetical protein